MISVLSSVVAISWEPELRGILVFIIAISVFAGSIYLVLATNLGARLGFLVALTGLAGWMLLMGIAWAFYGIGLKGREPSWEAIPGRTVLQDTAALTQARVLDSRVEVPEDATFTDEADLVAARFDEEGWIELDLASPAAGQAGAAAGEFLEEVGAFEAGQFQVTRLFDQGGDRYPKIGEFDLIAFWHEPHYVVVEVAAIQQTREEPGRAAPSSQIDESRQRQYVYLIRDLGTRRQPAFALIGGAGLIFFGLCALLHSRDARVRINVSQPEPATPAASAGS